MKNELRTKEAYAAIIELRKRIKNALYCLDGEESLLPIESFPLRSELIPWRSPVSLINVLTETSETATKDEDMKFLQCKINLDAPLKTILTDIESCVRYLQEIKGNPQRERLKLEVIGQDLRAYELQLQGKKVGEIAQELFPAQYERDKANAMTIVRRCIRRIKKMIKRGDI